MIGRCALHHVLSKKVLLFMDSMETFIVLVSIAAGIGGGLVLLACMAGRRAQLVKAFNMQQEMKEREAKIERNSKSNKKDGETIPSVSDVAAP